MDNFFPRICYSDILEADRLGLAVKQIMAMSPHALLVDFESLRKIHDAKFSSLML